MPMAFDLPIQNTREQIRQFLDRRWRSSMVGVPRKDGGAGVATRFTRRWVALPECLGGLGVQRNDSLVGTLQNVSAPLPGILDQRQALFLAILNSGLGGAFRLEHAIHRMSDPQVVWRFAAALRASGTVHGIRDF